ncbi:hypothetical protein C7B76_10695 [filamentous cyanobacterium CCP2]|nr:hypothetical protein C7B76_10695 [filamentous cyanobacterium CCP2]
MNFLRSLKVDLEILQTERSNLISSGWCLQHCWLVQVKPGGTARTDRSYWQVRSSKALFDGKKLKHLKSDEVEDYQAAIERGRQLKQIDAQISQVQQQFRKALRQTKRIHSESERSPDQSRSKLSAVSQVRALQFSALQSQALQSEALQSQALQSTSSPNSLHSLPANPTSPSDPDFEHSTPSTALSPAEEAERDRAIERLIRKNQELRSFLQQTIALQQTLVKQNRRLREQRQQTQAATKTCSAELYSQVNTYSNKQLKENNLSTSETSACES